MIGRNGHQRWPEALAIVHEFWRKLPPSYRFNISLRRHEDLYQSWDCSFQGFEGVRSQDILPLLLERFHFQFFFPFGNVIDPFVDRAFGPHFDDAAEWDRSFIDTVHRRDEDEMAAGRLKPTHLLAALGNEPCAAPSFPGNLSPQFCVRDVNLVLPPSTEGSQSPYDDWPHIDENDNAAIGDMFKRLRALTHLGATVIVVHHVAKSGMSPYRGASSMAGAVDAGLEVVAKIHEGKITYIDVNTFKTRLGEPQHRPSVFTGLG